MLTPEQKKKLKAKAHALKPVVMIAGKGLSENVMSEINLALDSHELIKVKIAGHEKADRAELIEKICADTGAATIQVIGHVVVLYRIKTDK